MSADQLLSRLWALLPEHVLAVAKVAEQSERDHLITMANRLGRN